MLRNVQKFWEGLLKMENPTYEVKKYAEKFSCHIKTILRAALDEEHPSDWDPDPLTILKVARGFRMKPSVLLDVMNGKEVLIDATASAEIIGVSLRRFWQIRQESNQPPAVASHGRVVRYLRSDVADFVTSKL